MKSIPGQPIAKGTRERTCKIPRVTRCCITLGKLLDKAAEEAIRTKFIIAPHMKARESRGSGGESMKH